VDYLKAVEIHDPEITEPSAVFQHYGLTDKYTWLNTVDFARRADGLPVRSLPLDDQYHKNPAYDVLLNAFATAPMKT
jgi:GH35 family endo-1,4-beta-xylanase